MLILGLPSMQSTLFKKIGLAIAPKPWPYAARKGGAI